MMIKNLSDKSEMEFLPAVPQKSNQDTTERKKKDPGGGIKNLGVDQLKCVGNWRLSPCFPFVSPGSAMPAAELQSGV